MTDLLTTNQVQDMLHIDRTTIYRMVESGRLPAIRVGKQWRFSRSDIERWLRAQALGVAAPQTHKALSGGRPVAGPSQTASASLVELLPLACSQMIQDVLAEALGVMIVITDMQGRPVTRVSNSCGLFDAVMSSEGALARCIESWQRMAGELTLEPRFVPSDLGLLCARGLIRSGNELKGMVLLGGIAPEAWPPNAEEIAAIAEHFGVEPACVAASIEAVHRLDKAGRERALSLVQRIADIFAHILEDRNTLTGRLQAIASLTSL